MKSSLVVVMQLALIGRQTLALHVKVLVIKFVYKEIWIQQFCDQTQKRIKEEVEAILMQFGGGTGHVFNLGHGITPDIKPENVRVFIDAVHELSSVHRNA
jgi:hypothetical protein